MSKMNFKKSILGLILISLSFPAQSAKKGSRKPRVKLRCADLVQGQSKTSSAKRFIEDLQLNVERLQRDSLVQPTSAAPPSSSTKPPVQSSSGSSASEGEIRKKTQKSYVGKAFVYLADQLFESPEDKERRIREREAAEAREKKERAERERREAIAKKAQKEKLMSLIHQSDTAAGQWALDLINFRRLKEAVGSKFIYNAPKFLSFAIGNLSEEPTRERIAQITQDLRLAKSYGTRVIYDADSNFAPFIAEALGRSGVGITAGYTKLDLPADRVIVIRNPYLKVKALSLAGDVAVSSDSPLGLGLALNKDATHYIQNGSASKNIDDWMLSDLSPPPGQENFGINLLSISKYNPVPTFRKPEKAFGLLSIEDFLDRLRSDEIETFLIKTRFAMTEFEKMEAHQEAQGAVVFGSGRLPGQYTQPLYKFVHFLGSRGIPISTGGAGGVMEVANRAAYDAGAESIGISLGGRLASEAETKVAYQTLTIEVSSYDERIPLLLGNRRIVIVAPGGGGTMKEVAATLAKISNQPSQKILFLFFGKKYYQKMVARIKKSLPASAQKHVHLVDSDEDMEILLNEYADSRWLGSGEPTVFRTQTTVARNGNSSFPMPPKPAPLPTYTTSYQSSSIKGPLGGGSTRYQSPPANNYQGTRSTYASSYRGPPINLPAGSSDSRKLSGSKKTNSDSPPTDSTLTTTGSKGSGMSAENTEASGSVQHKGKKGSLTPKFRKLD